MTLESMDWCVALCFQGATRRRGVRRLLVPLSSEHGTRLRYMSKTLMAPCIRCVTDLFDLDGHHHAIWLFDGFQIGQFVRTVHRQVDSGPVASVQVCTK